MRIHDYTTEFEVGDYAAVRVTDRGARYEDSILGFIAKVSNGYMYLFTNSHKLNGDTAGVRLFGNEPFRFSWALDNNGPCTNLSECARAISRDMDGADLHIDFAMNCSFISERLRELYGASGQPFVRSYEFNLDDKGANQDLNISMELFFNRKNNADKLLNEYKSNWLKFTEVQRDSYGSKICMTTESIGLDTAFNAEVWRNVVRNFIGTATSWDSGNDCSLIVRVNKKMLGSNCGEKLSKLFYFYYSSIYGKRIASTIFGRAALRGENINWGEYAVAVSQLGSIVLRNKEIRAKFMDELGRANVDNPSLVFEDEHVVFKLGRGSLRAERIKMTCGLCAMICKYVAQTPWQQLSEGDFSDFLRINAVDIWNVV